jgi:hypothetical protein
MPEPKTRFFLHSVAAANGHRVIYLSIGVGEKRPVRQATGYATHPAYFSPTALHLRKGADDYRFINEKLDELRLAVVKACRRLEDAGELSNAALAPLLKAPPVALEPAAPTSLPLAQQPMRAMLAA